MSRTPVNLLDSGAGKTRKAYVRAFARGAFDPVPGVVYDYASVVRRGMPSTSSTAADERQHGGVRLRLRCSDEEK